MGSVQLLLGRTRARRRRAIPAERLSGVDPFGRPTFLYVTGSPRKKAVVEREFLAYRAEVPTFAPRVRVLTELLDELVRRHGDGRAPLTDRARALVAERLLLERGAEWPWLARVANGRWWPVAEALADLEARLAESGAERLPELPHRDEIAAAVRALTARLGALPGRVTPAEALRGLLQQLDSPPPALVQWLRGTHSVVLDDVVHVSPLRTAVLAALCRAWSTAGAHVVVAFESGRGLGGREGGAFFGFDELEGTTGALKPFAASRALRRALFDELVATGGDTRVTVALGDRVVDAEEATDDEEPRDLVDAAWDGLGPLPLPAPGSRVVRFVEAADPEDEVRAVAREVKLALLAGAAPGDCTIAWADPTAAGLSLRAALADHGVPFSLASGLPLAISPVARLVVRACRLALDDFPAEATLGLLGSDLVRTPAGTRPDALLRLCRTAGVRSGSPATWLDPLSMHLRREPGADDRIEAVRAEVEAVEAAVAPLRALAEPATPRGWRLRVHEALRALAVPDRVARCPDPRVTLENLQAWSRLVEVLDALVADLNAVSDGDWPAEALLDAFERAIGEARWHPEPPSAARVQVVAVGELLGLTPRHLWVGGLSAGVFPRASSTSFLVPRAAMRDLGTVDPLSQARFLLASIARNALHTPDMRVTLSWPATIGGRPAAASPVIADLLAVRIGDGTVPVEAPAGSDVRLARSEAVRDGVLGPDPLLGRQREAVSARAADAFGPWDGLLDRPLPPPSVHRVTALETYLRCPARYWFAEGLSLREDEAWNPEVAASRRGTLVHRILERFWRDRGLAPLHGCGDDELAGAAGRLHAIAVAEFDGIAAEGGFEAVYLDHERDRWLAGLMDDRPAGLLRVWLDAERSDVPGAPIAVEEAFTDVDVGGARVRGRTDRVDRVPGGIVVTDYKTGRAPSAALVARGLALQPLAYAEAAGRKHGRPVAAVFWELTRPDAARRCGWTGDEGLVERLAPSRGARLSLDAASRARLHAHVGDAARKLARGRFHTTLAEVDEVGCRYCSYRRICRHDAGRAAAVREGGGDLVAPIDASGDAT